MGGSRDRQAAAEERRPLGGDLSAGRRRRRHPAAARLLLRARARAVRVPGRAGAYLGDAAHPDPVEHPQHQRLFGRRRRLAADAAGAGRARLSGERHLSSRRADAVRHRRQLRRVSARSPPRRARRDGERGGCAAGGRPGVVGSTCGTKRRPGPIASTTASRRRWRATRPAQVTITRYQSLDPIGHYFLRYAVPSEFGDVTDDERRRLGPVLERHYARDRRSDRPRDGRARPGGSAARRLRIRDGAARPGQAAGRAGDRRSRRQRHARSGAGRVPDGLRRVGRARPAAGARVGGGRCADDSLFPRPADRPRHGRLRARGSVPALVHRGAADHVHPDV